MRFIGLRLAAMIPVIIGASLFSFSLAHFAPGDPASVLLGPYASEADRASMREELALDQPLPVQYVHWLSGAVRGDLGTSIQMRSPVKEVLVDRFGNTLWLGLPSFLVALGVGLVSGVIAAVRRDGLMDKSLQVGVTFFATMPIFWIGLMLIYIFSIRLGWLPSSGMGPIGRSGNVWDSFRHLLLPLVTTAAIPAAIIARSARSAVLEVVNEDHVWAARARGVKEVQIIRRHLLKPALPSVLHVTGLQFAYMVGGTIVFAEVVFSWPGIGLQTVQAVAARDIPLIQGVVLLAAVVTVITNLVVDILHHMVDPQTRSDRDPSLEAWQ